MCFHRGHHQHSRHRLGGVHETAVVEKDADLIWPEPGEKSLLARDMPSAIARAVWQDGQIAALAAGLKPAGSDISQFVGGKRRNLVEDIALCEFPSVEKSRDALRDLISQGDCKKGERYCLVHHMFERGVVVVVAPAGIDLIEICYGEGLIETARLCSIDKDLAGQVDDGLYGRDRRRAVACLQTTNRGVCRQQELVWADLKNLSQGALRRSF